MTSRRTARSPLLKLSGTRAKGKLTVGHDHPDHETGRLMMMNALGTIYPDFANGLISQMLNAGTQGQKYDGKGPNVMLAVIQGVAPRDEVEAMLAAQMAAVHMATMTFARRLAHTNHVAVWVDATLRKSVNADPQRRYESLSEFIHDLRNPKEEFLRPASMPLLERNPVLFWKVVSLILAFVVAGLLFDRVH